MPGTRKLGRTSDQRDAMLRTMVTALFEKYDLKEGTARIETTVTRAKEVRSVAEKYLTLAKTKTLANYRMALAYLTKENVTKKLFDEIAPKYADINGGYTRITRIGQRRGDAAEIAFLEFVPVKKAEEAKPEKKKRPSRRRKAAEAAE
jgi:large subunit ribosomal protein L17